MKLTIALIVTRLAFANGQDYQALSCTSESTFLSDAIAYNSSGTTFTCSEAASSVAATLNCSDFASRNVYRQVQSTCCGGAEYLTELLCPEYEAYFPFEALSCTSESAFLSDAIAYNSSGTTFTCSEAASSVASSLNCSDLASRIVYRQVQSTCCGGAENSTNLLCPEFPIPPPFEALSCTSESAFLSDAIAFYSSGIAYTCSYAASSVTFSLNCSDLASTTGYRQVQSACCGGAEYSTELLCPEYPAYFPFEALSCTSESAFLSDAIAYNSSSGTTFTCSEAASSVASSLNCSDFASRNAYRQIQSTCCGGAEYSTNLLCPEFPIPPPFEALSCTSESAFLSDAIAFYSSGIAYTCSYAVSLMASSLNCSDLASRNGFREVQSTCCGGTEYLTELLCPEYTVLSNDEICDLCEVIDTNEVGVTVECYEAVRNNIVISADTISACVDLEGNNTDVPVTCKKAAGEYLGCSWFSDSPDLSNEDTSSSLFIAPSVSVMAVIVVIAFFA